MTGGEYRMTKDAIPLEDFRFLMNTVLLNATPEACKRELISKMKQVLVRVGERFILTRGAWEMDSM